MIPTPSIHLPSDFLPVNDDVSVTGVGMVCLRSLLAYLLPRRIMPQSRQQPALRLWPNTFEPLLRINLCNLYYLLRYTLCDGKYFWLAAMQIDSPPDLPYAVQSCRDDLVPDCATDDGIHHDVYSFLTIEQQDTMPDSLLHP